MQIEHINFLLISPVQLTKMVYEHFRDSARPVPLGQALVIGRMLKEAHAQGVARGRALQK